MYISSAYVPVPLLYLRSYSAIKTPLLRDEQHPAQLQVIWLAGIVSVMAHGAVLRCTLSAT